MPYFNEMRIAFKWLISAVFFAVTLLLSCKIYWNLDTYLSETFSRKSSTSPPVERSQSLAEALREVQCMKEVRPGGNLEHCFDSVKPGLVSCFLIAPLFHEPRTCTWAVSALGDLGSHADKGPHKEKSEFIEIVEWLLVIGLSIPFTVVVFSRSPWFIQIPTSARFHLIDWSLNAPPILGVLANLFSFAKLLADGDISLDANFLKYFHEAVITTIIGGMIYILNMLLKAFIPEE